MNTPSRHLKLTALYSLVAVTILALPERLPQESLIPIDIASFSPTIANNVPAPPEPITPAPSPGPKGPGVAVPAIKKEIVEVPAANEIAPSQNFRLKNRDVARSIEQQKRMADL